VALDRNFALHPALAPLMPYWQKGELLFVHASGNGYRTRSHFDAQDLMETGLSAKTGMSDGWLNRALALLHQGDRRLGLAVGGAVPLILRGAVPVASWEPPGGMHDASPEFIAALEPLYRSDALLGQALADGLKAQHFSERVLAGDEMMGGGGFGPRSFAPLAEAAGKLLAAPDGPRLAVRRVNKGEKTLLSLRHRSANRFRPACLADDHQRLAVIIPEVHPCVHIRCSEDPARACKLDCPVFVGPGRGLSRATQTFRIHGASHDEWVYSARGKHFRRL
jgi:hypothetical protein